MLKLTPTLLGHPTVKLGRLLQILSNGGLGKCIEILSKIQKVSNKFSNSQERFQKGLGLFGTNWEKLAILAQGDPTQRWILKQGTDPMKYHYEGLDGERGNLRTYINIHNFILMHINLKITKMARLVNQLGCTRFSKFRIRKKEYLLMKCNRD